MSIMTTKDQKINYTIVKYRMMFHGRITALTPVVGKKKKYSKRNDSWEQCTRAKLKTADASCFLGQTSQHWPAKPDQWLPYNFSKQILEWAKWPQRTRKYNLHHSEIREDALQRHTARTPAVEKINKFYKECHPFSLRAMSTLTNRKQQACQDF